MKDANAWTTCTTSTSPATLAALHRCVAQLLDMPPDEIRIHESILDQGLDSVRLMVLVERLRERGAEVDFLDFVQLSTIADWANLLDERGFSGEA